MTLLFSSALGMGFGAPSAPVVARRFGDRDGRRRGFLRLMTGRG